MAFAVSSIAQSPAKKGDYTFLKGETSLKISYDYDTMKVVKELDEDEYVAEKVEEGNEKEAGKGDEWKKSWEDSREARYQPKFESLINEQLEKTKMFFS